MRQPHTIWEKSLQEKKLKGGAVVSVVLVKVLLLLSHFSHVRLFMTMWTIALQAPLLMGFSRQEYWSGLPCPPPGHLPDPGMEHVPLISPALAGEFFTTKPPGTKSIHLLQMTESSSFS